MDIEKIEQKVKELVIPEVNKLIDLIDRKFTFQTSSQNILIGKITGVETGHGKLSLSISVNLFQKEQHQIDCILFSIEGYPSAEIMHYDRIPNFETRCTDGQLKIY